MDTAGILIFPTLNNRITSTASAMRPAGNEYIAEETLPENKLPIIIFSVRQINPYFLPTIITARRINTFETPILAPGKIMGGNKLSSIKASVASAVITAQ